MKRSVLAIIGFAVVVLCVGLIIYAVSASFSEADLTIQDGHAEIRDSVVEELEIPQTAEPFIERIEITNLPSELEFISELPYIWYVAGLIAYYSDGSWESVRMDALWHSSNEDVVIAFQAGNLKPTGAGTATIIAEYGGLVAMSEVMVLQSFVYKIETYPEQVVILQVVGERTQSSGHRITTQPVHVLAHTARGRVVEITDNPLLNVSSQNAEIVGGSEVAYMELTLGEDIRFRLPVHVLCASDIQQLYIAGAEVALELSYPRPMWNDTIIPTGGFMEAYAIFNDGTRLDITSMADWASDNEDVISVSAGVLTIWDTGNVTITARFGHISHYVTVAVYEVYRGSLIIPFP
jgi:hypothetical protein